MNFNQTCTDISFGGAKNYEILETLTLFFKLTGGQRMLKKNFHFIYRIDG